MAETQHGRMTEGAPQDQTEESREQGDAVVLTARLLANPRRVRRD